MRKILIILCSVFLVVSVTGLANAITITDLFGDEDGFGIGVKPGDEFYCGDVIDNSDQGLTDQLIHGDYSWTHTYDI